MFLQRVSVCLHPRLSPSRAVWSLAPVWMEDQDTWWFLQTELCVCRSPPFIGETSTDDLRSCDFFLQVSLWGFQVKGQTWGRCLQPGWCWTAARPLPLPPRWWGEAGTELLEPRTSHLLRSPAGHRGAAPQKQIAAEIVAERFYYSVCVCSPTNHVGLHQVGGLCGQTLLLFNVVSHITQLFL